jgi:hypothetical protein
LECFCKFELIFINLTRSDDVNELKPERRILSNNSSRAASDSASDDCGFRIDFPTKNNLWRIPEATLLLVAFLGGSLGSLLGMYTARHKTKHLKFTLVVPLLFFFQFILLLIFL